MGAGTDPVTTSTCAEVGNFLGNGLHQKRAPGFFSVILDFLSISGSLVTIIDTPGFGDDLVIGVQRGV